MRIIRESIRQNSNAFLQGYLKSADVQTNQYKYPAVIVVPGGSYTHISLHQAESFALNFSANGYQSFYLRYTFEQEAMPLMPNPLEELANSIKYIREHANEFNIDESRIVIAGFSIGGHICSLYNDFYHTDWMQKLAGVDNAEILKPNAVILSYPVTNLTCGFPKDKESILNWVSDEQQVQADEHVSAKNMPTFIWHTADDPFVPVENALKYSIKLNEYNVDNELHIFHHGPHGMGLANNITSWNEDSNNARVAEWFDLAITWLDEIWAK
ncbi:alpha/beta hydrolase [Apilactobacillus sp. HBW1]|uniref:Alpha/beta hydrolase n=1 Tax=Apilactobacillus waqarii TaxID=2851006 RepID=A0ABS6M3Y7_9LACO|nr:alpha/beta hydrolase [Apilactobacillus waqarii]MBV0914899.1 alpha/beta hydrolase [Apilactobacillus waqarii]